jgi:uncharacterized protein YjiS (DUF1127 family)
MRLSTLAAFASIPLRRVAVSAHRRWIQANDYVAEWRQRFRSRRDLRALDERALQDIHLSRLDAMTEGGKPFWKK